MSRRTDKAKGRPAAPEHLDGGALLKFGETCDALAADGRAIGVSDVDLIAEYAVVWSLLQTCERHVGRFGEIVRHSNKFTGESPFARQARQARHHRAELRRLRVLIGKIGNNGAKMNGPLEF